MLDPDAINQYFATIATDNSYCIQDVVSYRVPVDQKHTDLCPLWDYQTERLLRSLRTSSGFDDLPTQLNSTQLKFITTLWLVDQVAQLILVLGIKQMFFGLAGIVTRILNRSFTTGAVPRQ